MPRRPVQILPPALALLGALLSLAPVAPPTAAPPIPMVIPDWKTPTEYYPAPNLGQVKTMISGREARLQGNNLVLIKLLKIESFSINGAVEMTMEAPDCEFDTRTTNASSPGPLHIRSADGRLHIDGTGFFWHETGTNSMLTLSNNVETSFPRLLLGMSNAPATSTPPDTNQLVHISADSLVFDRNANIITYRGHVRVLDPELEMRCDLLIVLRTPDDKIDTIVADQNVVITSRTTGGQATGDHAVYSAAVAGQLVTLTGHPHWQDGSSEGTANTFVFDLENHLFREEGNASFRVPRDSIRSLDALLVPQTTATNAPDGATNFVNLLSSTITFQLPPTNGPVQSITADNNVIILDPADRIHASGEHANFSATNGIVMTGQALWQSNQTVFRGDTLRFDTNTQSFAATGNTWLKLPVSAPGLSTTAGNAGAPRSTNQFLEVSASAYEFVTNRLTFHPPVRAGLLDGDTMLGTLECGDTLTADFVGTNLFAVAAESDVHARQLPVLSGPGQTIERELRTDHLLMRMTTNGTVDYIFARRNVFATETETRSNSARPVVLTLNSEFLDARFQADTNLLDRVTAETNVVLSGVDPGGRNVIAHGAKAVVTKSNNLAVLTGDPWAETAGMRVTAQDGINYDLTTGRISSPGPSHWVIDVHALAKTNKPPQPQ